MDLGPKAVVLLSGGLDSATCFALAKSRNYNIYALTVRYGQRHHIEVAAARRIAAELGAVDHRLVDVNLDSIGGSALTDDIEVPKDRKESAMHDIPVTYVPARNTVLLAIALGYAEVVGAEAIFVGVNAVDYSGYPDCRPEYIEAFQTLSNLATKRGVGGSPIQILAPLIHMTKPEIIREGMALGLDYGLTHSCYDPSPEGAACGRCDSCRIRKDAFAELGLEDPALARP